MARGAMPYELASTFVFLASDDSSYMTGQVIHNNGGQVMGQNVQFFSKYSFFY